MNSLVHFFLLLVLSGTAVAAPTIDPTFGTSGQTRIGAPSGYDDIPNSALPLPDGRILVVGTTTARQGYGLVARFDTSGALDKSFGTAGTALLNAPPGYALIAPVTVDRLADGRLLVVSGLVHGIAMTRLSADGALDPTFGTSGTVVIGDNHFDPTYGNPSPVRVNIQPDGKILMVTDASTDTALTLRFWRFLADGSLDASFGTAGTKTLSGFAGVNAFSSSQLAVSEPSGGFTLLAGRNFFFVGPLYRLIRTTAQVDLDTTFGSGGSVIGADLGLPNESINAFAATHDGGYVYLGATTTSGVTTRSARKLDATGHLVSSFGDNGRIALDGQDALWQIAETATGALAIVGTQYTTSEWTLRLFEANGSPRKSFGSDGVLKVTTPAYQFPWSTAIVSDAAGRVTSIGSGSTNIAFWGADLVSNFVGYDVIMFGANESGVPRTFGRGDGISIWNNPSPSNDVIDSLLVDDSGRITAIGYTGLPMFAPTDTFVATRLRADGTIDPDFGDAGRSVYGPHPMDRGRTYAVAESNGTISVAAAPRGFLNSGGPPASFRVGANGGIDATPLPFVNGYHQALRRRPDGKTLTLSFISTSNSNHAYAQVVTQFNADGTPDTSFGINGKATIVLPAPIESYGGADLVLLPDGSSVVATFFEGTLRLDKLDASGRPSAGFGTSGTQLATLSGVSYQRMARLLSFNDGTFLALDLLNDAVIRSKWLPVVHGYRFAADGALVGSFELPTNFDSYSFTAVAMPDSTAVVAFVNAPGAATLVRVLRDGRFDDAFGGASGTQTALTSISALAVDAQGRIVAAGQDRDGPVIARYAVAPPLGVVAPPTVSMAFSPTTVSPGALITLTFTLTNPTANTLPLSGVGFVDTLQGLVVLSPNRLTGSCGGGTITATPSGSTITLAGATLPVNGSCTFSVGVEPIGTGTLGSSISAGVSSANGGSGAAVAALLVVNATMVPALSTWSVLAISLLTALAGLVTLRRREYPAF